MAVEVARAFLLADHDGAQPSPDMRSRSLNNAPFKGAEKVLSVYAQRIYEAIQRDGFYVRVASGKQFYIYVLQTIDRSDAVIGGTLKPFAEEGNTNVPALLSPAAFGVAATPTR